MASALCKFTYNHSHRKDTKQEINSIALYKSSRYKSNRIHKMLAKHNYSNRSRFFQLSHNATIARNEQDLVFLNCPHTVPFCYFSPDGITHTHRPIVPWCFTSTHEMTRFPARLAPELIGILTRRPCAQLSFYAEEVKGIRPLSK